MIARPLERGVVVDSVFEAAPNVARKLFDADRPEKSLHSDRLGSSDG